MRKRFSLGAICSADGTSGVYNASRRAHLNHVAKCHEDFQSSGIAKSFAAFSTDITSDPDYIMRVYKEVRVFGEWQPLRRYASNIEKLIVEHFEFR